MAAHDLNQIRRHVLEFVLVRLRPEFYEEHGLLEPEPTGFNLLIYVLPVIMLLGGAAFVYFKAREWTRRPASAG